MPRSTTIVRSRKYVGTLHRSWTCELISRSGNALTFVGVFDRDVEHSELGSICSGTISYEFYWLDRWYNVFRFHEPDGAFRNYYCNINLPPKFDGETLEYVDLDIDVLVWPDQRVEILDRDEFAENLATYGYPIDVITNVDAAVAELLAMIENREFPFEYPERSA